jgi:hypothetical protein
MVRIGIPLVVLAALVTASAASAQGEAVRLTITAAPVVARDVRVGVRVAVDADPGAMNTADGPVRLRVKFAPECGSTFRSTPGPVVIDQRLPAPGAASAPYSASLRGEGVVAAFGSYTVCAFVEGEGDDRLYGADTETQFQATQACTTATRRHTHVVTALRRAVRTHAGARKVRQLRIRLRKTSHARRAACS